MRTLTSSLCQSLIKRGLRVRVTQPQSKTLHLVITEMVEELFTKIREEFGEFDKESRKVDELRLLKQGGQTCDEYCNETVGELGYPQ